MAIFENPANGYQEKVTWASSVAVFFFGAIYLLFQRLWFHALVYTFCVLALFPIMNVVAIFLVAIIYAFCIGGIMRKRYLRNGWREVIVAKK